MKEIINIYPETKVAVQPEMTGLFFEDINYSADGGLYAELIENRNFEFYRSSPGFMKGDHYTEYDGLYGWSTVGSAEMKIIMGSPVAEENPHYLRVLSKKEGDGFSNKAYDGITLLKNAEYKVSFYARNLYGPEQTEYVTVSILDNEGKSAGSIKFNLIQNDKESRCFWNKYEAILKAEKDIRGGKWTLTTSGAGCVEFDFVSMIPSDAVCGIFRKDLFDKLDAIHPGFIRFPGGCIVEGATLSNRYDYKKTIKPLEHRQNNWSRWAVHRSWQPRKEGETGPEVYPHYNQTYGIGFYEFFLLCEKLGCKPLPVLNVGMACQFQCWEMVSLDSKEFQQYVQDAIDLIEFANGPVDSVWGKVRADLGHPEPFNLEMVGIGNEQWETEENHFLERYAAFESAIHNKYPQIKLIGSVGPGVDSEVWPQFNVQWNYVREKAKSNPNFVYAMDEHYYMPPEWFLSHMDFYDNYDRSVKVFAGEYAAHPEGSGAMNRPQLNTLEAAVCEAAFMTGVERNADVVVLASYAPLFARMGWTQWSPDMIWFDDEKSYGTPSYWVQLMYSNYTGSKTLDTHGEQEKLYSKGIYYNPTIDEKKGEVFVKIANTNDEDVQIALNFSSFNEKQIKSCKQVYIGGLEKNTFNSLEQPDLVTMKIVDLKAEKPSSGNELNVSLPKNSFSVFVLQF